MWLLNEKPFNDETEDDQEPEIAGRCIKAPKLWRDVTGIDVVIWARKHFWDQFGIDLRRALVLHELLHIEVKRDKDGAAKIALRKHDVEDFVDIARKYGPNALAGDGGRYVRAAALFAGEPEPAMRGRSTSRRASPAQAAARPAVGLAHDLVDAVVADPEARARDHATIDENAAATELVCVGSNHVPGCVHMGGEIPPKRGEA